MCAHMYACVSFATHPSVWNGIKRQKKNPKPLNLRRLQVSVLQSQKIHSKSYLSRSGCGKTFSSPHSTYAHHLFLLLSTRQAGSWRDRNDGLLPASNDLIEKSLLCLFTIESCLILTTRDASASILQILCWQCVHIALPQCHITTGSSLK